MSFLSILWLSALTALTLPVVLHLIRSGRPRRIRLGTIRLLREGQRTRARSWRPSQLLLMLVRCLVLAALVLALAEPRGWPGGEGKADGGLILAGPQVSDPAAQARIARLEAEGHELRLLERGDVWSQLREVEDQAVPGQPFFVFADAESRLRGTRPTLRREVEWTVLAADPAVGTEPAAAASRRAEIAVHFSADREDDAGYLTAALEAIGEHLGLTLEVGELFPEADLTVWLSPEPVPESVLAAGGWILSDGLDRHQDCQRKVFWRDRPIELRRCSSTEAVDGEAVWSDGAGQALLTASRARGGVWWRFQGRFHPRWSNLVLTPAFPAAVLEFLPEALVPLASASEAGLRVADASLKQARPRLDLAAAEAVGEGAPVRDSGRGVELWLWAGVAGFFLLERFMALKGQPKGQLS